MPLKWGDDDTKDQMLGRALSYLVLFSTLGIIIRWSIGVRLLTSAESDPISSSESEGEGEEGEEEEDQDSDRLDEEEGRRLDSDLEDQESQYYSSVSTNNNNLENTPLIGEVPHSKKTRKTIKKNPSSISFATTATTTTTTTTDDNTLYNHSSSNSHHDNNHNNNNSKISSAIDLAAAEEALSASQIQLLGSIKAGGVLGGVKPNPHRKNSLIHQQINNNKTSSSSSSKTTTTNNNNNNKKRPQSIFQSFPNTPLPSNRNSVYNSEEEDDETETESRRLIRGGGEEDEEWGAERGIGNKKESWLGDIWSERLNYCVRKLNKVWKPIEKFFKRIGDFVSFFFVDDTTNQ